ncbi:F-box family protein [Hibiscus syriacus]|uniref:F-box family protein n=1 Tax=Hibiscus syriacus TaxID=106335 RepID=A0A6A3BU14_HIBSY|nr:F-box family protein [Hibiscus syriacus]
MSQPKMLPTKKTKASSSNSCQISSADTIASNDDILALILHRLPLKSSSNSRQSPKDWLSLIAHPRFRPKHDSTAVSGLFLRRVCDRTNPKYDMVNLGHRPSRAPFRSLTFVNDPSGIKILQSCNGLLLCCSCPANRLDATTYYKAHLQSYYKALHVFCFTNSYSDLPDHYWVKIYSPETGPWRPSGRPFVAPSNVQFKNGVLWNGAICWLSDCGDSPCFDLEEERMRDIPMPSVVDEDIMPRRYFGESGGHLHHVKIYGSENLLFDVLKMERDYSGWFVKYRVDLNPVAAAFPEMVWGYADPIDLQFYAFSILCVVREESDEGSFMVQHLPAKI